MQPLNPLSTSQNSLSSKDKEIGHLNGHTIQKTGFLPPILMNLILKIKDAIVYLFKKLFSSEKKFEASQDSLSNSRVPDIQDIYHHSHGDLDLSDSSSSDQLESSVIEPSDSSAESSSSQLEASVIDPSLTEEISDKDLVRDVPDDGNCLFYSVVLALNKKYRATAQRLLHWSVNPSDLPNETTKLGEILEKPAKILRTQAKNYLTQNKNNEEIQIALAGGIIDCQEKMRENLDNQNMLALQLSQSGQLSQNSELIKELEADIEKLNGFDEKAYTNYLTITGKEHVHCGTPQILALAKIYDIPIKVIFNYGKGNEKTERFNFESTKAPITLAYVNGNHFQFVDD